MNRKIVIGGIAGVLVLGSVLALQYQPAAPGSASAWSGRFESGEHHWSFGNDDTPQASSGKIVTVPLPGPIDSLSNRITVDTEQACDTAKPRIEIDSTLLDALDQEQLQQGIIRARYDYDAHVSFPPIKVYGGAMKEVSNNGTANITLHCAADQLKITNRGTGDTVLAQDKPLARLVIDNYGTGNVHAGNASVAQISNLGTGEVKLGHVEQATVTLMGVGNVSFANAPKLDVTSKGIGIVQTNVVPH